MNTYYNENKDIEIKEKYYADFDFNSINFRTDLTSLLKETHLNSLEYQQAKYYLYLTVDIHPGSILRSIYSGQTFTFQELMIKDIEIDIKRSKRLLEYFNASDRTESDNIKMQEEIEKELPYNCEHVVPKSWFKGNSPMMGDLNH